VQLARSFFVGALLALAAQGGQAQQAGKIARVGVLNPGSSSESVAVQREPFERGLRELGWLPGSNVIVDYRYGEGNNVRLEQLAADLVRQGANVIIARGNVAIRAARQAAGTVPIVMSSADDPVADGFVKNLARPGVNVTGIANLALELDAKRLELLKDAVPGLKQVAVLTNPSMRQPSANLKPRAHAMGLELRMFEVERPEEIAPAFAAMKKAGVAAVLVRADTQVLEPHRPQVVAMAAKHRLPAIYPWHFYAEIGGLISYGASLPAIHHRSATYVDRILKGAKAGEMPIEQPTQFELIINVSSAKALDLVLPQSLLFRADRLVQ